VGDSGKTTNCLVPKEQGGCWEIAGEKRYNCGTVAATHRTGNGGDVTKDAKSTSKPSDFFKSQCHRC